MPSCIKKQHRKSAKLIRCCNIITKGEEIMAKYDYNFSCFKQLREEMFELKYNMYPFFYSFNNVHTFAAIFCISDKERKENPELRYVLFRLVFMKKTNLDDALQCFININGITDYDRNNFREYFNIRGIGYGDFMNDLCKKLVSSCPKHAKEIENEELEYAERHSLCRTLKLNPSKCYRKSIIRLSTKERDPNTYQLALRLFPHAAKQYEKDKSVTYGFTDDKEKEVPEEVAIERFIKRESKRKGRLY